MQPYWLVPAPFVASDILDWPRELDGRIVLGYPTPAADRTPGRPGRPAKAPAAASSRGHQAMQVAALGSAMVLVEGLSRAGRDLSRQKLLAALEGLQGFETGLTAAPELQRRPPHRFVRRLRRSRSISPSGAFQPLPDFIRLQ